MLRRALVYGFSMIEIMIVIAIAASLALVGVPAYKRYVVKGNVAVVFDFITGVKLRIQSDYAEDGVDVGSLTVDSNPASTANVLYKGLDIWGESAYPQISYVILTSGIMTIGTDKAELGLPSSAADLIITITPTFTAGSGPLESWTCTINSAEHCDLIPRECRDTSPVCNP